MGYPSHRTRIQTHTMSNPRVNCGPSLANKTQAGENETFVLFGLWLLGCEIKAAGESSLEGSWSEGKMSQRSKEKREENQYMLSEVEAGPAHVSCSCDG